MRLGSGWMVAVAALLLCCPAASVLPVDQVATLGPTRAPGSAGTAPHGAGELERALLLPPTSCGEELAC